jgi:hypothetical protein
VSQWNTRTRHFAYASPGSLSLAAVAALLPRQLLRFLSSSTTNSKHPSDIFPPRSRATEANEKPAALQRVKRGAQPMLHDGITRLPIAVLPQPCRQQVEMPPQRGTCRLIIRTRTRRATCRPLLSIANDDSNQQAGG